MQLGGISAATAFDLSTLILGLMVIGNMTGWVFVEWIGRRGTALYGVAFLSIDLLLIGILACVNAQGAILGQVGLMAVWAFCKSQSLQQHALHNSDISQSTKQPSVVQHGQSLPRTQHLLCVVQHKHSQQL